MTDSDVPFASDEYALARAVHAVYGAAPEAFVATRKEWVAQLRAAGLREMAKEVGTLRKPSVAAAAVNALVRADDPVVKTLHEVGARMRQAQSALDVAAMAALRGERDDLLSAWVSAARRHAPGGTLTASVEAEVRDTAVAALADPAATEVVTSGNLTRALSYSGFGEVDVADAVARTSTGVVLTRIEGGRQDSDPAPPAGEVDDEAEEPADAHADGAFGDRAEEADAEEAGAEEADAEKAGAEEADAKEADAEQADAEEAGGHEPADGDDRPEHAGDGETEPDGEPAGAAEEPGSDEAPDDHSAPSVTEREQPRAASPRSTSQRPQSRRAPSRPSTAERVAELEMELDEAEKAVAAARENRKIAATADAAAETDVNVAQEQVAQAERLLKAARSHLDKAGHRRAETEEALKAADKELASARRHRDDTRAALEEAEDA